MGGYPVCTCQEGQGEGKSRVRVLCHPVAGRSITVGQDGRVHSVRSAVMDTGTLDHHSPIATVPNNPLPS